MVELSNIKKNNEHVWATVFCNYINKTTGADYEIVPELEENSPVDMHLVSANKNLPHIDLQLTHAIEVPFVALKDHMDVDFSNHPTVEAISRKQHKLTQQGADLNSIVLVIQGYMNRDLADQAFPKKLLDKYAHSDFAGIYYVAPPMISDETHELMQDGVVIPIKDYFLES